MKVLDDLRIEVGYWYLASVYTSHPAGLDTAFRQVCRAAGTLLDAGVHIFSPIAHGHPISDHGKVDPLNHDVWMNLDFAFIKQSRGVLVLMQPNWEISKGIKMEMHLAQKMNIPIVFLRYPDLEIIIESNGFAD